MLEMRSNKLLKFELLHLNRSIKTGRSLVRTPSIWDVASPLSSSSSSPGDQSTIFGGGAHEGHHLPGVSLRSNESGINPILKTATSWRLWVLHTSSETIHRCPSSILPDLHVSWERKGDERGQTPVVLTSWQPTHRPVSHGSLLRRVHGRIGVQKGSSKPEGIDRRIIESWREWAPLKGALVFCGEILEGAIKGA